MSPSQLRDLFTTGGQILRRLEDTRKDKSLPPATRRQAQAHLEDLAQRLNAAVRRCLSEPAQ